MARARPSLTVELTNAHPSEARAAARRLMAGIRCHQPRVFITRSPAAGKPPDTIGGYSGDKIAGFPRVSGPKEFRADAPTCTLSCPFRCRPALRPAARLDGGGTDFRNDHRHHRGSRP